MRLGLFLLSRCFLVCGNMNLGTLDYWVFCMLIVNFIFVVRVMICSLLFCGFHHCFHTHVGQYSLIAMQKTLNFSIHFFFKLGYKLGSLCFSVPSINGALEL